MKVWDLGLGRIIDGDLTGRKRRRWESLLVTDYRAPFGGSASAEDEKSNAKSLTAKQPDISL